MLVSKEARRRNLKMRKKFPRTIAVLMCICLLFGSLNGSVYAQEEAGTSEEMPENPEDPNAPEEPEKREEPEKTEEPGKAEEPEKREEPGKTEEPEKPETPDNPEDPQTPDNPEDPQTPGTPENPENPNTVVVSWKWTDQKSLNLDDEKKEWVLKLTETDEAAPVTKSILGENLPDTVSVSLEDETTEELTVSWNFDDFPENGAYNGRYTLRAALPEGYAFAKDLEDRLFATVILEEKEEKAPDAIRVISWKWVDDDKDKLIRDDETNRWTLALPGAGEENPVTLSDLEALLPVSVLAVLAEEDAEVADDPEGISADENSPEGDDVDTSENDVSDTQKEQEAVELKLSWNFDGFPEDGVYAGTYILNATMPEGYVLAEDAEELAVTLELGGVMMLDEPTLDSETLKRHTVSSVEPAGATVNLFDYWITGQHDPDFVLLNNAALLNAGINDEHLLVFGRDLGGGYGSRCSGKWNVWSESVAPVKGIVNNKLDDGFPKLNLSFSEFDVDNSHEVEYLENYSSNPSAYTQESLKYLFDPDTLEYSRANYSDVTGLFQLDQNGYYYYDSQKNYAEYIKDDNKIVLYDSPGVHYGQKGKEGMEGQFFPFDAGSEVFHNTYVDDISGNNKLCYLGKTNMFLDCRDARLNHYFGMTLQVDFRQPVNGKIAGKDMTFEFSGDDDVWIFIDDVLVADLGGNHDRASVSINFATGEVKINEETNHTIKDSFEMAGAGDSVNFSNNTFTNTSTHTLKMFYLERGNYASNLRLSFNLMPQLYHEIKKVDQDGEPLEGVSFKLSAVDNFNVPEGKEAAVVYADIKDSKLTEIGNYKTNKDGIAQITDKTGNKPFNFADRGNVFYVLEETKSLDGYRPQTEPAVLRYDKENNVLVVNNTYNTGAYASFFSTVTGIGEICYSGGNPTDEGRVPVETQKNGLVVAVPMLKQGDDWAPVYGSNRDGFSTVDLSLIDERFNEDLKLKIAILSAALYQSTVEPDWYLSWNDETKRLEGTLTDLPGSPDRYLLKNKNGDLQMYYAVIEPEAFRNLDISEDSSEARYKALGEYVQGLDSDDAYWDTIQKIMNFDENDNLTNSLS